MNRKPIGLSVPYRKIGCVQHDCEKCQRGWVGLTYEEQEEIILSAHSTREAINKTEWKLKEKNT